MKSCLRILQLASMAAVLLAGCSNGSSTAPVAVVNPPPPPLAVAGVVTPRAVSVVTAN